MPVDTTQYNSSLPSQEKPRESSGEILERLDWYIRVQTKRIVRFYPALTRQELIDLEIDELMQRVRIKLWLALEKRTILYPHTYIKRMIHNELIDMQRQRKPTLPLPTDEEEQGQFIEATGITLIDTHDPADEVEQQMESSSLLGKTVPLVLRLPPRQRLAMMCSLKESVDDLIQLNNSFKAHQTDIEKLNWPTEHHERRILQSSLVVARRTIAKQMEEEMTNEGIPEPQKATALSIETDAEAHLTQLKEPYQSAIRLHCVEGISYPETAAQLHLPVGTVKAQVSRGKKLLRSFTQGERANKQIE